MLPPTLSERRCLSNGLAPCPKRPDTRHTPFAPLIPLLGNLSNTTAMVMVIGYYPDRFSDGLPRRGAGSILQQTASHRSTRTISDQPINLRQISLGLIIFESDRGPGWRGWATPPSRLSHTCHETKHSIERTFSSQRHWYRTFTDARPEPNLSSREGGGDVDLLLLASGCCFRVSCLKIGAAPHTTKISGFLCLLRTRGNFSLLW